jgi:glycerol-3-phosphate acyltransferase PlsY
LRSKAIAVLVGAIFGLKNWRTLLAVEIIFVMVLAMALILAATTWAFSPNPAAPIPPIEVIYQPQHWNAY